MAHTIKLEWNSAAEYNLAEYIVERSSDGKTFVSIETVKALGKASTYVSNRL